MANMLIYGFDITEYTKMFQPVIFMIVFDVVTGILASAKKRRISSSVSFSGIIRKLGLITAISFIGMLDNFLNLNGNLVGTGSWLIMGTELMSIIENFSVIGIDINFVSKYFDEEKVDRNEK